MSEHIPFESGHGILEADMKRLAQEVLRERENPENRGVTAEELLKRSIEKLTPVTSQTPAPQAPPSPLPEYLRGASPETKLEVEYLLDMAFHHGIEKANAAARKSNLYVADAFHDALAGKLYPELKKRGLL